MKDHYFIISANECVSIIVAHEEMSRKLNHVF